MTPKEKAEGLVSEMCLNDCTDKNIKKAKQYALIAVDNIFYGLRLKYGQHLEEFEDKANYFSYWEEVKNEINNL
jgi:hypothetical protein